MFSLECKLKENHDKIFYSVIVALIIAYAILIVFFCNNHVVSPDVLDFQSKLNRIYVTDFWSALKNNTLLLYVLKKVKILDLVSIAVIQVFSILLLSVVLLKKIKPYYVALLFLIVFYNLLCNLFRQSIAISVFLMVYLYDFRYNKSKLIVYLLSLLTHFFSITIFSLLFLDTKFNVIVKYKKFISIFVLLSVIFGILFLDNRILMYLIPTKTFVSLKFLLCFCFLFVNRNFFENNMFQFFLFLSIACGLICFLPSLSTRISELVLIMMFVYLGKGDFIKEHKVKLLNFILALGYFIFSTINIWVVKRDLIYKIFQNLI